MALEPTVKGWNLKLYGAHLSLEKDGHPIAHIQGGLAATNPDVLYLTEAVKRYEELLEALKDKGSK